MGKLSVIIYITLAILLLLLISKSPQNPHHHLHRHRHRRLKLRSNFTFTPPSLKPQEHHVAFDPLVAEIERKREDREWEKKYFEEHDIQWRTRSPATAQPSHDAMPAESQPEWDDFMDAEDYLNDEDKFNVTNRLLVLFPKVDVHPTDGFVTEPELTRWNLEQSQKEVLHRSKREFEIHDKNKDGFVSFSEYEPPSWVKHGSGSFGYEIGWWKEDHFNASDANGDGLLNVTEFNDFLHPADTQNPRLLNWLCKEEVRERDTDKDGKVSFKEFFHGLFDLVRNYDEEDHHNSEHHSDDSQEAPAKQLFALLDKDGDGFVSDVELLPVIGKLHPSEHYYAKQQAEYIIQQADSDKDGRLTLDEMIENPYVFYSAIFNDDEEDDFEYHDEFR